MFTEPRALRRTYLEVVERFLAAVRKLCAASGIDYVLMSTADPLDAALASYLALRRRTARTVLGR